MSAPRPCFSAGVGVIFTIPLCSGLLCALGDLLASAPVFSMSSISTLVSFYSFHLFTEISWLFIHVIPLSPPWTPWHIFCVCFAVSVMSEARHQVPVFCFYWQFPLLDPRAWSFVCFISFDSVSNRACTSVVEVGLEGTCLQKMAGGMLLLTTTLYGLKDEVNFISI